MLVVIFRMFLHINLLLVDDDENLGKNNLTLLLKDPFVRSSTRGLRA